MDGVMVALAYELAYRLRFDSGIPHRYQLLLDRTIVWAVVASLVIFVLFRLYQKWFRYVTGRDYVAIAQAIIVATLSLPAFVATTHPVKVRSESGFTTVNIPLFIDLRERQVIWADIALKNRNLINSTVSSF